YIDNPAYPDIGLEEKEKDAIRQFVGSSMLKVSDDYGDIVSWPELCKRLGKGADGPTRRARECLPNEVKALIPHVCTEGPHGAALKSLVVKALNDVLRRVDFYREEDFVGVNAPQPKELLPLAQRLRAGADPLSPEELKRLVRGASIPLPHEAKEA